MFPWPDKVKANDKSTCVAVISCISTTFHSDALVCMAVVSWSRSVTSYVVLEAVKATARRVVIDVGSSMGMAVVDYTSHSSTLVLFVELDVVQYIRLLANIGSRDVLGLEYAAEAILRLMSGSRSGTRRFKAINGTIKSVLDEPGALHIISASCGAIVYSFSLSHAPDSVNRLYQSGVRIVGCGYFYNKADISGIIVNCHSMSMKADHGSAVVAQETDEPYYEHAI